MGRSRRPQTVRMTYPAEKDNLIVFQSDGAIDPGVLRQPAVSMGRIGRAPSSFQQLPAEGTERCTAADAPMQNPPLPFPSTSPDGQKLGIIRAPRYLSTPLDLA